MEFSEVKKEHILDAIQDFNKKGIPNGFGPSSTYNLEFEGKTYPPKAIMAYANFRAIGKTIEPYFKGGIGTDCFKAFERNGFNIVDKGGDKLLRLIEKYKLRIQETKLENEIYKWKLLNKYKGRPNLEAGDLFQEVKSVKFNNLVYAMGIAVLNELVRDYPNEMKILLGDLFNDEKDLKTRVKSYSEESLKLYRQNEPKLAHHQDERSISSYLAFQDANKYPLYKDSFYKKFCKLKGVKHQSKGNKYIHYKTLLEEFISEYIKSDQELIELVRSYLPNDAHEDRNHYILAQDILYQMLDQYSAETNYWIFQCNPDFFDIETSLKDEVLDDWTVSAYKDKIKPGDKVIIWVTGGKSGCYALAEVKSEPHHKETSEDDELWKTEKIGSLKAEIKITHNLVENPILKSELEDLKEFENFKAGAQGTNFSSNKNEYEKILSLLEENKSGRFEDFKSHPDFESYIKHLKDLIEALKISKNDQRVALTATQDKLTFTIGQRYCFTFYIKDKRGIIGFISTTPVSKEYSQYNGNPEAYLNFYPKIQFSSEEWQEIIKASKVELNRTSKSSYLKYSDSDFINYLFNTPKQNIVEVDLPKNLILYGPPGTGKTYKLSNEYFNLFTEKKKVVSLEDKQKELADKHSWWEVITICMLDLEEGKVHDVLNHSLLQAKSNMSETKNVRATIWSLLQTFTKKDCPNVNLTKRRDPEIFWKDDKSVWSVDTEVVKEQLPELYEDFEWMNYSEEQESSKLRFKTVTFHQSYSYEDFIEGIKPVLETEGTENSDIGYQIEAGIFKKICLEAKNDPNKPYAIFIDEINRGNVASVFGELITLIEADKRAGEKNEISLELPYSKKSFSVPSNLHIIGTMNTADRSVEALDTALRRRFSFVEMIPEPNKIESEGASKGKIDDIDLVKLLSTINERIEVLVDRDHTIGHAFFMSARSLSDLKAVIADKIIPLLQEYFYGDYHKMELVLGSGFFEKKAVDKVKFAVETDLQFEGEMFTILDAKEMNDNDFKAAITGIGFNAE